MGFIWEFSSLLICLKIFKENKTRGCLLCVVGPMESTAASVSQPLLYSGIWSFHVVGTRWPTNLAPPQNNRNPEVVSMALGSETRFQVLASLLYVWLWNSGLLTSETQFPHEYTWNQNNSYLVEFLRTAITCWSINKETGAKCLGQCLPLPYYAGVRCMLVFIFHINIPKSELFKIQVVQSRFSDVNNSVIAPFSNCCFDILGSCRPWRNCPFQG